MTRDAGPVWNLRGVGRWAAFPGLRLPLGPEEPRSPGAPTARAQQETACSLGNRGAVPCLVSGAVLCGPVLITWELER